MVRKKVEGDEDQRRAAAHRAHKSDEAPSARGQTTGGSKQRTHVPHSTSLSHEERTAPVHRGKQRQPAEPYGQLGQTPESTPYPSGRPDYGEEHEQVFRALVDAEREHGGEGVYVEDVARAADLPAEETRTLLHDLVSVHHLVTELQGADAPDQGPRFETKPRL
ncbi:hypothetical protein G5C60_34630 [Streptomyces sp. HC44]|uniref:Uncharacterized protein n=1 Tax=Streptomyces scabichelini TaxID=2711217 RepID=A0A6G4VFL1_9ACTN|nr:hypothetical protein [Streptomyces scabichelini]NGO12610.1 hypothetical protein [Streptomyces scabichelini]